MFKGAKFFAPSSGSGSTPPLTTDSKSTGSSSSSDKPPARHKHTHKRKRKDDDGSADEAETQAQADPPQPSAQREAWMTTPMESTAARQKADEQTKLNEEAHAKEEEKQRVEEEKERQAKRGGIMGDQRPESEKTAPAAVVGDGGAGWRRRILQHAGDRAREEGHDVREYLQERHGSLESVKAHEADMRKRERQKKEAEREARRLEETRERDDLQAERDRMTRKREVAEEEKKESDKQREFKEEREWVRAHRDKQQTRVRDELERRHHRETDEDIERRRLRAHMRRPDAAAVGAAPDRDEGDSRGGSGGGGGGGGWRSRRAPGTSAGGGTSWRDRLKRTGDNDRECEPDRVAEAAGRAAESKQSPSAPSAANDESDSQQQQRPSSRSRSRERHRRQHDRHGHGSSRGSDGSSRRSSRSRSRSPDRKDNREHERAREHERERNRNRDRDRDQDRERDRPHAHTRRSRSRSRSGSRDRRRGGGGRGPSHGGDGSTRKDRLRAHLAEATGGGDRRHHEQPQHQSWSTSLDSLFNTSDEKYVGQYAESSSSSTSSSSASSSSSSSSSISSSSSTQSSREQSEMNDFLYGARASERRKEREATEQAGQQQQQQQQQPLQQAPKAGPATASGASSAGAGSAVSGAKASVDLNKLAAKAMRAKLMGNTAEHARIQAQIAQARASQLQAVTSVQSTPIASGGGGGGAAAASSAASSAPMSVAVGGERIALSAEEVEESRQREAEENKMVVIEELDERGVPRHLLEERQAARLQTEAKAKNMPVPSFQRKRKEASKLRGETRQLSSGREVKDTARDGFFSANEAKMSLTEIIEQEKLGRGHDIDDNYARSIVKQGVKYKVESTDEAFDVMDHSMDMFESRETNRAKKEKTDDRAKQREMKRAIQQQHSINQRLERCTLCYKNYAKSNSSLVVAVGDSVYVSVPQTHLLVEGQCRIVPMDHTVSVRSLEPNAHAEFMSFRRQLVAMFAKNKKGVIFMELVTRLKQQRHTHVECFPVSFDQLEEARMVFLNAVRLSDTDSQNKNLTHITKERGLMRSVPINFPYFAVEFGLDGGYAHVIDDEDDFKADFGLETMLGVTKGDQIDLHRRPSKNELVGRARVLKTMFAQFLSAAPAAPDAAAAAASGPMPKS